MSMKINKFEIENVKRVKAVSLKLDETGLTVLGGKNKQGKSSVLDAIAWALGGAKYEPKEAKRRESTIPPNIKIVMNNGLVVERKGKNSDLKVTDPTGQKAGQKLLDEFVEELAINLPKFMESSNKEKASTLLQIIGVGEELAKLTQEENELYNERLLIGREMDRKKKFAEEQDYYPDAPKEPVAISNLIEQQQDILARNGENQRKRHQLAELETKKEKTIELIGEVDKRLQALEEQKKALLDQKEALLQDELILNNDILTAKKTVAELKDESTEELEASIRNVEEINVKVRANLDKEKAEEDAKVYETQYNQFTTKIESVRKAKTDLLQNANLPLPELSVEDGELVYKGFKWGDMSGSEQLIVSTAIVRKLKPNCGFVLMDKMEQFDTDTLAEFGKWVEAEGLQVIATRVTTNKDECTIIIEDGYIKDGPVEETQPEEKPKWTKGEF